MRIVIFVYLLIGILLNIIGPLAKKINEEIIKMKKTSFADELFDRKPYTNLQIILFEIILRILGLIFYPFLYLIIFIDSIRTKSKIELVENNTDNNLLYFWNIEGTGNINCINCGFNEEIVSFLHGYRSNSWTNSGFQCQTCGKFHVIINDVKNSKGNKCECGGELTREEPLFCPKCKTNDISYIMHYIT